MTKEIKEYDLRRVLGRVKKDYGFLVAGTEEECAKEFYEVETTIYRLYKDFGISDYDLQTILLITIYDLKGLIEEIEYDYTNVATEKQIKCSKEIQMKFNPFINKNILITDEAKNNLKELFTLPIQILARIHDSINIWREIKGKDGYFKMLEEMVLPLNMINKYPYALDEKYLK